MALNIPHGAHPVAELVDLGYVSRLTAADIVRLPDIPTARKKALEQFQRDEVVGRFANILARAIDGRVLLIAVGKWGGYRVRWNFGRLDIS